jgi:DNA mismatch endonuclease (patch repair protein)
VVFSGRKKLIFEHGCFWHRHPGCKNTRLPKSRLDFWKPKLFENRKRDIKNQRKLNKLGWHYLVVWECQTKHLDLISKRIKKFLEA